MRGPLKNTLGGRTAKAGMGHLIQPKMILALVLISVFSFAALVTLSGFASDLRSTNNGRAHALSNSAIGYAGIVELLRAGDIKVVLDRTEGNSLGFGDTLHVITLTDPYQMPDKEDFEDDVTYLVVMPKWRVASIEGKEGWVKQLPAPIGPSYHSIALSGALAKISDDVSVGRVDSDDGTLTYDLRTNELTMPILKDAQIRHLQTLSGDGIVPVIRANHKTIVGRLVDTSIFVLSEPDILNTSGISQRSRARYARDMIVGLMNMEGLDETYLTFDLHVHGFGKTQNLVKTLLSPPFLAATLCLLAAGFLVAWQAFARFGDPVPEERNYALGKFTLADNGARFIKIAGKETGMADGYLALIKRRAARAFHMEKQPQSKIEAYFERQENNLNLDKKWQILSRKLTSHDTAEDFLMTAKDLHTWKQEITDDGQ